ATTAAAPAGAAPARGRGAAGRLSVSGLLLADHLAVDTPRAGARADAAGTVGSAPLLLVAARAPGIGPAEVLDLLRLQPLAGALPARQGALGALGDVQVGVQVRRGRVGL